MTKHILAGQITLTGEGVTIDAGWERGRQCFYLTLYIGDSDDVRYDSDMDLRFFPGGMTQAEIDMALQEFGLTLPDDMWAALRQDQQVNAAPYICHHTA